MSVCVAKAFICVNVYVYFCEHVCMCRCTKCVFMHVSVRLHYLCQQFPWVQFQVLVSHPAHDDDLHHHLQQ